MQAGTATIIAFPRRVRPREGEAPELAPAQQVAPAPAATPASPPLPVGAGQPTCSWTANLLIAAPFFLSARSGTAGDLAAILLAILAFSAASWAARALHGKERDRGRASMLAGIGALFAVLPLGPAVALLLLLLASLELIRSRLPDGGLATVGTTAAGHLIRLEAGAAAVDLAITPELRACALLLGLFLALAARSPDPVRRPSVHRELLLLALLAAATALYTAGLLNDPWMQRAAGVSALLSVPALLAGLARYWQLQTRPAAALDPWLAGAAASWAALLGLSLRPPAL